MLYTEHTVLLFGFEEFEQFLKDFVFKTDDLELEPYDCYYWQVKCGRKTYDSNDLLNRLSKVLGTKISTSHTDQNAVWLVLEK